MAKAKKRRDIWSMTGLETRCRQLVLDGALVGEEGLDGILKTVTAEFAEKFPEGVRLTKKSLASRVPKLIWTATVLNELRTHIRHRLPMEDVYASYYAWIPKRVFFAKVKFLTGLNKSRETAEFVAGVGRLITSGLTKSDERYEFPENSPSKPIVLKSGPGQVIVANAMNVGVLYDPIIEASPFRRALAEAGNRGAKATVITNIVNLFVKRTAGVGHVDRARVSGIKVKLEHLPASYRKKAAKILERQAADEVVFQGISAKFLGVIEALEKVSNKPLGKGYEFNGPVYAVLSILEEELILEAANAELRYIHIRTQNKLVAELRAATSRLTYHEKRLLRDDLTPKERKFHEQKAAEYAEKQQDLSQELALCILTNVSDDDRKRHYRRCRALVVKSIEKAIPNCTVIGQNVGHFVCDGLTLKVEVPRTTRVSDTILDKAASEYGRYVFEDTFPDLTIECHPYSYRHSFVGREDSRLEPDGTRTPVTKFIHQAPMCVDGAYLQENLRHVGASKHPLVRTVYDASFKPGVMLVTFANGMVRATALPIPALDRAPKADVANYAWVYPRAVYINWLIFTDPHAGSRSARRIPDPKTNVQYGVVDASTELFRREGLLTGDGPFHLMATMDDLTNGDMFFQPRYQPDPWEMSVLQIERWMGQMNDLIRVANEKGDKEKVAQLVAEMQSFSVLQFYLKGDDWPHNQMMQVYDRLVEAQIDVYASILRRFEKSELNLNGISKLTRWRHDARDLGVINWATGNHRTNTLKKTDVEGDYFARHTQACLSALPQWRGKMDYLKSVVRAPRFGHLTFGWGTVQAPGRFEWGIRIQNSPARQDSWSDILKAVVRSDIARGDSTYALLKRKTVTLFGDKHFYAFTETGRMVYAMCGAGTHSDLYGDTGGFPPNNTGIAVLSLPADGPDSGPVLMTALPHDWVRDWFAKPRPIDWSRIIPPPV
jgi:hypothetical protein